MLAKNSPYVKLNVENYSLPLKLKNINLLQNLLMKILPPIPRDCTNYEKNVRTIPLLDAN